MKKALKNIVTTDEAQSTFYPTPDALADRLLENIEWGKIETVLEPSAGKGNLVSALVKKGGLIDGYRRNDKLDIDCIEIDPHLRSILQYEFCGQRKKEYLVRKEELEKRRVYNYESRTWTELSPEEAAELKRLGREINRLRGIVLHVVHDDFLSFGSRKKYDLIVMNPPFTDGDAHLLKAIELQSRNGGQIRCILNAETLRNPCTNRRKVLLQKLDELGADVEYVDDAFTDAERKTDVSVAVIKIDIPAPKRESAIFERLKAAAAQEEPVVDVEDLTVDDFIGNIVAQFNVEVDAGIALIREYIAMLPYIMNTFDKNDRFSYPILSLRVGNLQKSYWDDKLKINEYLRLVRSKYWAALFSNEKFVGKLTSNLREKYQSMVSKMADYDFTVFNIRQVAVNMNAEMKQGIEDTIVELFDKLTQEHSWYPECAKNIHYYNGWATNKAHMVNKKVIIPVYDMFSSWDKDEPFKLYNAASTVRDIEKVFNFLQGNSSSLTDSDTALKNAYDAGQRKDIKCKHFSITFYKKGTMHIKFYDQALVDRFNIYCGQKKNWLPPCYGKTSYHDMSAQERAVVDGFHGDGSEGAGETAYQAILERPEYFLADPTRSAPALLA